MLVDRLITNKTINRVLQVSVAILFIFNGKKKKQKKAYLEYLYRNEKKRQLASLIYNKYPDCYCVFSRYGLGDVFFVASLIKEFKSKNNARVVYFTEKKRLVKFLRAFSSIDEVVWDKNIGFLQSEQTMQNSMQKGKLNKLFFPYRGTKETYTFSDNYNNLLDVSLNAERELPVISEENYKKANLEFEKLKVDPNKTVLLIPDATMFDYNIIHSKFWYDLVEKLENKGYDVVFNCKLKKYKKFKNTFLPVMDFLALAGQVKHIVSFRSGVSDLLTGMGYYNQTVLYPPNLEVIWADAIVFHDLHKRHIPKFETEFDNMFSIHSLNTTFKTNKINELIYNYNDSKIINQILECLK